MHPRPMHTMLGSIGATKVNKERSQTTTLSVPRLATHLNTKREQNQHAEQLFKQIQLTVDS